MPAGTWLPLFYNDKKRTFFVLPALDRSRQPAETTEAGRGHARAAPAHAGEDARNPGSTIRRLKANFRDAGGFLRRRSRRPGPMRLPLSSLPAGGATAQISDFLRLQFPDDPLPPYTDAQAAALAARWYMRYFHVLSERICRCMLFQFRQFDFRKFYHPLVCDFARLVNNPLKGIDALMTRETQLQQTDFSFKQTYQPTPWVVDPSTSDALSQGRRRFHAGRRLFALQLGVVLPCPAADRQFAQPEPAIRGGARLVSLHLQSDRRGERRARRLRDEQVLDHQAVLPDDRRTSTSSSASRTSCAMLAGDTTVPGYSPGLKDALDAQVLDWRTNPFEPHRIAAYRTVAYQKTVVMKYLDNLIAWGDYLFGQDSMESINEATQTLHHGGEILGPSGRRRCRRAPSRRSRPSTRLEPHFDSFSNELVQVENLIPPSGGKAPSGADDAPLPMLYFCVPQNDKLLDLLGHGGGPALQDPPLHEHRGRGAPVGAVRAADRSRRPGQGGGGRHGHRQRARRPQRAAAVLPLPDLLQKANEVCGDVKALGGALLAALEKKDAEALALLRQTQELRLLDADQGACAQQQLDEAKQNVEFDQAHAGRRPRSAATTTATSSRSARRRSCTCNKMGEAHSFAEAAQGTKLGASVGIAPSRDRPRHLRASARTPVAKAKFGGWNSGRRPRWPPTVLSLLAAIASDDAADGVRRRRPTTGAGTTGSCRSGWPTRSSSRSTARSRRPSCASPSPSRSWTTRTCRSTTPRKSTPSCAANTPTRTCTTGRSARSRRCISRATSSPTASPSGRSVASASSWACRTAAISASAIGTA